MAGDMEPVGPAHSDQQQMFEQLLENQKQDLELRAQQLELDKQKDNNALAFGRDALKAQAEDRAHERELGRKTKRDVLWLVGVLAVMIVTVVIVAMCMDKDAIAQEVIKAVIYVGVGGAGGYGVGRAGRPKGDNQAQAEE